MKAFYTKDAAKGMQDYAISIFSEQADFSQMAMPATAAGRFPVIVRWIKALAGGFRTCSITAETAVLLMGETPMLRFHTRS